MDINNAPFDNAGCCPPEDVWNGRKKQFRYLETVAVGKGEYSQDAHGQRETLVRELEHTYCAGAWISSILLAQSIVEITLAFHGFTSFDQRESFLKKYSLNERAKELRFRRNAFVHRNANDEVAVSLEQILFAREELRYEAKKAVALALSVAFLGLKYPDVYGA